MTNGVSTAIAPAWRLAASRLGSLLANRYTFFLLGVYAYSLVVNLAGVEGTVAVKALGPGGEVDIPGLEAVPMPAGAQSLVEAASAAGLIMPVYLMLAATTGLFESGEPSARM